jgi:3-carboxy-cis,cis-muconate cycloisomerase
MAGRFTDGRVGDAGVRALFAVEHRWQRWLDVEAALAAAEADAGLVPAEAGNSIPARSRRPPRLPASTWNGCSAI